MIRNGLIPLDTLTTLSAGRAHRLRSDAAAAYERMAAAFRGDMGYALAVTDAYRDLLAQYAVKAAKGFLAATPGKSNHGWGLALDLASGVNIATSAAHRWMDAHANEYGWVNPAWAQTWKFEPWHWEYVVALDQHDGIGEAVAARPPAPAAPTPILEEILSMTMPIRVRHHKGGIALVNITNGTFRALDGTANGLLARLDVPIPDGLDALSDHEWGQIRQLVRDLATPMINA